MAIEVSIAVNSYRSPELLRLCLQAVRRELSGATFSYEVLVVDSATEEDTEMLLREEFPEVRFFPHTENVGFGRLINTSIRESVGKYLFFINDEVFTFIRQFFANQIIIMIICQVEKILIVHWKSF